MGHFTGNLLLTSLDLIVIRNHIFGVGDRDLSVHYISFTERRWQLLRVVYSRAYPL